VCVCVCVCVSLSVSVSVGYAPVLISQQVTQRTQCSLLQHAATGRAEMTSRADTSANYGDVNIAMVQWGTSEAASEQ